MKITFEKKSAAKAAAYVVFATEDGKLTAQAQALDKKAGDALKRAVKAEGFDGKKGKLLTVAGPAGLTASHVIIVGLGKVADLKPRDFEKIGSSLTAELNRHKVASAVIDLGSEVKHEELAASNLASGLLLNSYRFDKYLTREPKEKKPTLKTVSIVVAAADKAKKDFDSKRKLAEAIFLARDLVSEVPNVLYPESYAAIIKRELAPLGIEVKVLNRKEMQKLGMGALVAVGIGSEREERLVTMQYRGGKKTDKNVAFVGKGITFDTGGISIKPAAGMEDMKWDMAGSAAVVGLMKALASRKAKVNAVGVVALAENMPSGGASRPGDIVTTMSGQTVEILNTDAEGRLVLCDALWYTQEKFKPTHIIDLATLTGAVIIALGHEYGAVFSNDDLLPKHLIDAGQEVGEHLWQLPLNDAWDKAIDSPAADIKNISGGRDAGSSIGAHFLKRFIQKDVKWAHLDIAGMAWTGKDKPLVPKGAVGFGVRLLNEYVREHFEG
jgi:leucyl aminopeptidase